MTFFNPAHCLLLLTKANAVATLIRSITFQHLKALIKQETLNRIDLREAIVKRKAGLRVSK